MAATTVPLRSPKQWKELIGSLCAHALPMLQPGPQECGDLASWRECRDCGLFQCLPAIPDGEAAVCARCDALLRRAASGSVDFARASSLAAAVLFVLALTFPYVQLRVFGRFATSTLMTGPKVLGERGLPALAVVVLAVLVVMPAVKLAIELTVLFGMLAAHPPRWLAWLFGWLERISPWAMVEVFLLASFVAYTRLRAFANVDIGLAVPALGGVMFAMVATDATLDREAVWRALDAKAPPVGRRKTPSEERPGEDAVQLLGCHVCGRVVRAAIGDACPRCAHRLFHRKANSTSRVWALIVTAALVYLPANVLPVMTVKRFGRGSPTTILHGVIELAADHLWPLAILVFLASVVVPVVKLVSLALMLITTHRRSSAFLKGRSRLFRFVHAIGRWSMIDIFILATLVGVVKLGFIAMVLPGLGAVAFCGVVLLTMVATEFFDPRLMWDRAGLDGASLERRTAQP